MNNCGVLTGTNENFISFLIFAFPQRVDISKKENVLVPNLPSIAGDVVSCSSQVFPL